MSMLAIDIETASPHSEPADDRQNTDHFELVAVGVGYQDRPGGSVETEVLFREGDWGIYHTADLLSRVKTWAIDHNPNYAITYNGDNFDKPHLLNWAQEVDEEYKTTSLTETFETIFDNHIDLSRSASAMYSDATHESLSLEETLDKAGIDNSKTYYNDYTLPQEFTSTFNSSYVHTDDIERTIGEAYVTYIGARDQPHTDYTDLEQLLSDYTIGTIEPLFELSETLRQTL